MKPTSLLFCVTASLIHISSNAQLASQTTQSESQPAKASSIMTLSDIEWGLLNPARGDNSPRAGTLWGDRTSNGPSGFLVQFVEGFSSAPHIHNVTYKGVVISGLVHNDDPAAANMWLPEGSFWTQPAGESHITSAQAKSNLAYIEIEQGPYLVRPADQAFDNGERPVNVHPSNLVWVNANDVSWSSSGILDKPPSHTKERIAFLWGRVEAGELSGTMIKLAPGYSGQLRSGGTELKAVVVQGKIGLMQSDTRESNSLSPGSYFGSSELSSNSVSCLSDEDCIVYVRSRGKYFLKAD